MSAQPGWLEALLRRLAAESPDRVLLLAPADHPIHATLRARLPGATLDAVTADALPRGQRYPLALVAATLETLPAAAARELLAALRDRLAAHVVLWLDAARAPVSEDGLRALAYRVHARDGTQLLCGFDLYDYKDRPDWLNANHWAHPELWGKFRW